MRPDRLLAQAQIVEGLTGGDAQLAGDQIDVGDLLGNGVLDLDAWIHLDEDVMPALVQQELHGARTAVADVAGESHCVGTDFGAQLLGQVGSGRQLDDFLVASLHAAVPLVEMDHVAVGVGQDLDLDVAWVDHGLLEVDRRIPERRLGFSAGGFDGLGQRGGIADTPHPAAPAPGNRLDEQRELHVRPAADTSSSTDADGADDVRTGRPASRAAAIARDLLPVSSSTSALGPTNVIPASAQAAASSGFSDKNP